VRGSVSRGKGKIGEKYHSNTRKVYALLGSKSRFSGRKQRNTSLLVLLDRGIWRVGCVLTKHWPEPPRGQWAGWGKDKKRGRVPLGRGSQKK